MNSAFTSWPAFLTMGGYAFYFWLAVAVTLTLLATLVGAYPRRALELYALTGCAGRC